MHATAALGPITDLTTNEHWTTERLAGEISRRALLLARHGVGPGDRVLIAHGGTPRFFADLFAVWQRGACAACLDGNLTEPELRNVADFLGPSLALVDADFARRLDVPTHCADAAAVGDEAPPAPRGALDDPALILFTSGTTGEPKGVVHSFRSLLARAALNRAAIGDDALTRSLCLLPTHFGHGLIGNALTPLLAGRHLFLPGRFGRDVAGRLGEIVTQHEITFLSSVPTMWKLVLECGAEPPARAPLQVHVGSAPLSADLWRTVIEWAGTRRVVNMYGITECANWIGGASAAEVEPEDGLIGTSWGGQLAVLDGDGRPAVRGEGELLVHSPSLMSGYLDRDDLTAQALGGGWFHTGDLGRIDAAGQARLSGRLKHEINRAGVKIQPEDVDLVLERHDVVLEACTFGIADELRGEIVGTAVRLAAGAAPDEQALAAWCAANLRKHAVPERWFFVDEIPRTDRGKINRDRVREACLEPQA